MSILELLGCFLETFFLVQSLVVAPGLRVAAGALQTEPWIKGIFKNQALPFPLTMLLLRIYI